MNILQFNKEEYTQLLFDEGSIFFPLLNSSQVEELKAIFGRYHAVDPKGFYATTHLEDKKLRKEISDQIKEIVFPELEKKAVNANLLGGAFISKAPGEKGILPLHQDWNIVDEEKARSYNLWIPLCDVSEFNGAMRILPQSHRKEKTYRGPNIAPTLSRLTGEVNKHMHNLDMKAGEALIYDHALWHSSPVNQSNELRLAIVIGVIPQGTKMKYYRQNGDFIEEYNSHANFFFENDRENGHQDLQLNKKISFKVKAATEEEFNLTYLRKEVETEKATPKKRSFLEKLSDLFQSKKK